MSTHSFSLFPPPQPQRSRVPRPKARSGQIDRQERIIATLTKPPGAAMVASTTTKGGTLDGEGEITVQATTVIRVESPTGKPEKPNDELGKSRRKSLRRVAKIVYPMVPKRTATPVEAGLRSATTSPSMEKAQAHGHVNPNATQQDLQTYAGKSPRMNQRLDWGVNQVPTPINSPGYGIPPGVPSPPPIPDPRSQNTSGYNTSPSSSTPKSATAGTPSTYHVSPSTAPTSAYTSPRISQHNKFTPPLPEGPLYRSASPPSSPPNPSLLGPASPPTTKRSPSPALRIHTELNRGPSPPPTTPPPQPIASIFPVYNPQIPLHQQKYFPAYNPHTNPATSPPRHHISRDYSANVGTAGSPPLLQSPPPTQTSFGDSKDPNTIGLALSPTDGDVCGPLGGFVRYEGAGGALTAMPKENMQRGCGPVFPAPPREDFDGTGGEKKRRKRYEERRARAREEAEMAAVRAQMNYVDKNPEKSPSKRAGGDRKQSKLKRFFAALLRGRW